jgi:molybdopterin converting factor small subunit
MADSSTTPTPERTSTTIASMTPPARVLVRIPGPLRPLAGGADEIGVDATTVGGALAALLAAHPALRRHLRADDGSLREHVNIFRNEDDVRYLAAEDTPVEAGDTITIVPSIAGG